MGYGKMDVRVARRGEEVLDAIVAKSSLVLRKIGAGHTYALSSGPIVCDMSTNKELDHDAT